MVTIINLAFAALAQVLNLIAEIRGQSGMTDDAINTAALTAAQGNDALYLQMVAAIKGTPPAAPATQLSGPAA